MEEIICKVLDIREFQNDNYHIILKDIGSNCRYSLYIKEKIFLNNEQFSHCFNYEILIKGDILGMIINRETSRINFRF